LLGILIFTISLALSRLLDTQLRAATKTIITYLESHKGLRNAILKYF